LRREREKKEERNLSRKIANSDQKATLVVDEDSFVNRHGSVATLCLTMKLLVFTETQLLQELP
jgi:hypothetical protein